MAPVTRMFRDRMVSMEQTLERGEKHLEFLKNLCKEVFPEFEYREHSLDHERDLFLMILEAPDGRRKSVGWTRMVLFDSERLPALLEEPSSALGLKIRNFLRERTSRPEIVVTFRHLEDGWIDTPEPRREKRRRRRRDRARQPGEREGQRRQAEQPQQPGRPPQPSAPHLAASGHTPRSRPVVQRPPVSGHAPQPPAGSAQGAVAAGEGRRRRRRFRRRRGRGRSGTPPAPGAP